MTIGQIHSISKAVTVIGCGRWGSFIGYYLDSIGESVTLYEPVGSRSITAWQQSRRGELLNLPETIMLETDLLTALQNDTIIVSIHSQNLSTLMRDVAALKPKGKTFVLCMKGVEVATGKRLSVIANEHIGEHNSVAVWVGPGHVQDLLRGVPTCMVIDSEDAAVTQRLAQRFSSKRIRMYYGTDLVGSEVGAAAKNVIGIGAGLLDGADMASLKGALISRGAQEVAQLIVALGGDERSAYGLAHLGDYEATVFSVHSHNRAYGEAHVRGEKFDKLAEGYHTTQALLDLAAQHNLQLPIMQAIYEVIYNHHDIHDEIDKLFSAELSAEF